VAWPKGVKPMTNECHIGLNYCTNVTPDSPRNAGKHVVSKVASDMLAIHLQFSLLFGPKDVMKYAHRYTSSLFGGPYVISNAQTVRLFILYLYCEISIVTHLTDNAYNYQC